jgi:hypothetical protein
LKTTLKITDAPTSRAAKIVDDWILCRRGVFVRLFPFPLPRALFGPRTPKDDLNAVRSQLKTNNPKIDELIKENPGLGLFLSRNSVSTGPRPGEAKSEVAWDFWTHSAATNQKYGHGMTDAQILSDYIVVVQPSSLPQTKVDIGGTMAGYEIIGVYKVGDEVSRPSGAFDGGHLGRLKVHAHGRPGDAILAWAVVSIDKNGNINGGGYPTKRAGAFVPYQDQPIGGGGGGEYHGRAARITHGQKSSVPLTS